jgi:hypothetical protein
MNRVFPLRALYKALLLFYLLLQITLQKTDMHTKVTVPTDLHNVQFPLQLLQLTFIINIH